ncbi:hypothetical protein JG687_00011086 [Phytophthora cactorum]|uniref:Uncharacterized protein n=1 Tax=Phytophthora cactorum TaxID=29920 RepID=A0A8T1U576_9STRA|nr:hypothetical protein JG687_00011086 [Phytophthora cactorum]
MGPKSRWLGCNEGHGRFLIERVMTAITEPVILTCLSGVYTGLDSSAGHGRGQRRTTDEVRCQAET